MSRDTTSDDDSLLAIRRQLDLLTAQVGELAAKTEEERQRQQAWRELTADLAPLANDAYLAAVEQLAEVEPYVRLDDMLFLLKRLARNTRNVEQALDQLESLSDLVREAAPLSTEAFAAVVGLLDTMERRGYIALAREAGYVLDQIAGAFGPEDVHQLGDNIVTILTTMKEMTQPEVMGLAQSLASRMQLAEKQREGASTSLWGIMRQLRDPEIRRGLAITMEMLRAVGEKRDGAGDPVPGAGS